MYVPGLKYRATNTFFQSNGVETKCQLAAIAASLSAEKFYHLSSVTLITLLGYLFMSPTLLCV